MAETPFGHESSAIAVRRVLSIGILLAVFVIGVASLIHFSLERWIFPKYSAVVARRGVIPPRPRLQPNPAIDKESLRKEKDALLSGWRWTDQTHAYARIPIERAMSLYLSQHAERTRPPPPPDLQARVGIRPHLGIRVPLNLSLREADGTASDLRTILDNRATLLVPGYYACANLCGAIRAGVAHAVARVGLTPGKDFNVVLVSIDPRETPRQASAAQHTDTARLPAAGVPSWHYLTGTAAARDALLATIGFAAWFDNRNGEYAHPAALVVLSPQGAVTQYLTGVHFDPQTLRLAMVDASAGHIGTWVDRFILLCCDYDPATGRYSLLIQRVLQGLGAVTALTLGGLLFILHRREEGG